MTDVICKLDGDPDYCPLPYCGCERNMPPADDPAQIDIFDVLGGDA